MKIEYLQKLDFLLKKVNNHNKSKNYKLLFGMNNKIYTGDFIPKITYENFIEYKDVDAYDPEDYSLVGIDNFDEWKTIANIKPNSNKSSLGKLIDRSSSLVPSDYFQLLDLTLQNYPIEFEKPLLPYIYNLREIPGKHKFYFVKLDENIEFDFISIVPENEL
ncbi:hypothetical protein AB4M78_11310 [Staphylococcus pasteuri]|uniref:hypothetical protein n=1 Tax=Staphylococcus pasteuri TaxID=45972 RepID=UPI0034C686B2